MANAIRLLSFCPSIEKVTTYMLAQNHMSATSVKKKSQYTILAKRAKHAVMG
jgi:hypothetical protein